MFFEVKPAVFNELVKKRLLTCKVYSYIHLLLYYFHSHLESNMTLNLYYKQWKFIEINNVSIESILFKSIGTAENYRRIKRDSWTTNSFGLDEFLATFLPKTNYRRNSGFGPKTKTNFRSISSDNQTKILESPRKLNWDLSENISSHGNIM